MEELPRIADRITVLRDGKRRRDARRPQTFRRTRSSPRWSAARSTRIFPSLPPVAPTRRVRARGARTCAGDPAVNGVSFEVRAGEIVGLAGLVGAGRTEIVRAIAGADVPHRGEVSHRRQAACRAVESPRRALRAGIAFITEDRKAQGLVLGMTVRENVTLAHLADFVDRDLLVDSRASATRQRA